MSEKRWPEPHVEKFDPARHRPCSEPVPSVIPAYELGRAGVAVVEGRLVEVIAERDDALARIKGLEQQMDDNDAEDARVLKGFMESYRALSALVDVVIESELCGCDATKQAAEMLDKHAYLYAAYSPLKDEQDR